MAVGILAAGPASAANFNCFEWVRVSTAHVLHPHRHHPHRAIGVPHRRPAHVQVAPRVHRIASPFVRRPIACPEHETALASPIPGAPPHETLAMLETALAGPAPAAIEAAQDTAAILPAPPEGLVAPGPDIGFPFGPPGVETPPVEFFPGPTPVGGGPGTPPIAPPLGPPVTPPVAPPEIFPPVTPPPVTPLTVTPPEVFPLGPPPFVGPTSGPGPGPGPSGSIPEPAAWSLMLVGLGAAGAALRNRRRLALRS